MVGTQHKMELLLFLQQDELCEIDRCPNRQKGTEADQQALQLCPELRSKQDCLTQTRRINPLSLRRWETNLAHHPSDNYDQVS